jgi:hypothetical protein
MLHVSQKVEFYAFISDTSIKTEKQTNKQTNKQKKRKKKDKNLQCVKLLLHLVFI